MSEVIITDKEVKLVVEYKKPFNNEAEMIEAVKGAIELRGLVENEDPNEESKGAI